MPDAPRFPEPKKCTLWRDLKPLEKIAETFEAIETYMDESHHRRLLMRCRECGHLYFYEFREYVDYENGNDPQYRTFIPVTSPEDAAALSSLPPGDIAECIPAIHIDWPKDEDRPSKFWLGRSDGV